MADRIRAEPGPFVGDHRETQAAESRRPRDGHFRHSRHAYRVGAESSEHAHFGRGLVRRPQNGGIRAAGELDTEVCSHLQSTPLEHGIVGRAHVRKAVPLAVHWPG